MIQFFCPTCFAKLRASDEHAGTKAKCKKCKTVLEIPLSSMDDDLVLVDPDVPTLLHVADSPQTESSNVALAKLMNAEEIRILGIDKLNSTLAKVWLDWGMRMYSLSQNATGYIEEIKYNGHVIVLDDGSRWEVDEYETSTSENWSEGERVVVIDEEMYKLDDNDKISVEPQS